MTEYHVDPGRPYFILAREDWTHEYNGTCCDCGLVHNYVAERTHGDHIILRAYRDDKTTRNFRRRKTDKKIRPGMIGGGRQESWLMLHRDDLANIRACVKAEWTRARTNKARKPQAKLYGELLAKIDTLLGEE